MSCKFKKIEKVAESLFCILKILEDFCEYTNSEDTNILKPTIKYAKCLSDEIWYTLIDYNEEQQKQ